MWPTILLTLLSGALAAFYFTARTLCRRIHLLENHLQDVQQEERRVFEYLHGLGEAFSVEIDQRALNRFIVEASMRILKAQGGAIYLADKGRDRLVAAFLSESCPPLAPVPRHILEQAGSTPVALESYLRLHAIEAKEGLLGAVWTSGNPIHLPEMPDDKRLDFLHQASLRPEALMACRLTFGGHKLGVLALANGPMGEAFSKSDFEVFKAISEQSAFALYNSVVYAEASEKKRLDTDLQTAREIQSILLPDRNPSVPGFDICGMTIPARYVSGDYYDYLDVAPGRTGVAIADVSGKGVPASLIMAMCRSVLRSFAPGNDSPAAVLEKVNQQLYPDIKEDMFISMAYLLLAENSPSVTLCRAGHDAPLLYTARDRAVTRLNPRGMAMGIDSGQVFGRVTADFSVNLEPGDCIVLYTDGMTEAIDAQGFEFGLKRMIQSVQAGAPLGAADIIDRLTGELRNFVGDQPQYDDVTLIAIRKL